MVLKDVILGFRHGKFIRKTAHPVRLKQPECSCGADKHQVKPKNSPRCFVLGSDQDE
jgi:hypothetical protein